MNLALRFWWKAALRLAVSTVLCLPAVLSAGAEQPMPASGLPLFETPGAVFPGAWSPTGETFYATLHNDDVWQIIAIEVSTRRVEYLTIPLEIAGVSDTSGSELLIEGTSAGQQDVFVYNLNTKRLRKVTDTQANEWHPAFGATPDVIIYDSNRGDNLDLYRQYLDRGNVERLTNHEASEQSGRISPDGRKLAFHRHMGAANYDIFVKDLETGSEKQVTFSGEDDSYPRWLLDGRAIIFSSNRSGQFEIYGQCLGQENVVQLTRLKGDKKYPKISPSGRQIAMQVQEGSVSRIELLDIEGAVSCPSRSSSLIKAIATERFSTVNGFTISADFTDVYATHWVAGLETRRAKLVRYRSDGQSWGPAEDVFPGAKYQDYQPVLSPDQQTLYFTSTRPVDGSTNPARQNIWFSRRSPTGSWVPPQVMRGLISTSWDGHAVPTSDDRLYFASERAGGEGMVDIYFTTVRGTEADISNMRALNSPLSESDLYVDPQARFMFFTRYDPDSRDIDIFYALNSDAGWQAPKPAIQVNSDQWELSPVVTPDLEYLIYVQGQQGKVHSVPLCRIINLGNRHTDRCS